jgi:hypothetical protein
MPPVKLSRRALEARVKRALEKDQQSLRKCRPDSRGYTELGDYYIIDHTNNTIAAQHVDLEDLARELEVFKPYEELAD